MYKKIVLLIISVVSIVFAVGCTKRDLGAGKAVNVQLNVTTAPELASKAGFGEVSTATKLNYAIYEGTKIISTGIANVASGQATVNALLLSGAQYEFIFWADAFGNEANGENPCPYTVAFDATGTAEIRARVDVDYSKVKSGNDLYDAYYHAQTETVTSNAISFTLRRAFAQVNLGTNDLQDAIDDFGFTVADAKITTKISKASTTMNLSTGTVVESTGEVTIEGGIPSGYNYPVSGYDYLTMAYFLAPANKSTYDIEFDVSEGDLTSTIPILNLPVCRNFRTNIYGQLLVSSATWTIELDVNFDAGGSTVTQ